MARSTRLLLIGAVVFAVGVAATLFTLQSGDPAATAQEQAEPDPAPTATATTPPTEGTVATGGDSGLPDRLDVPEGTEAVAVNVSYPQGVAALPGPGDHVNVYGVFTNGAPGGEGQEALPMTRRVLTQVRVLARTGANVESAGSPTYVLALTGQQTERMVLLSSAEQVWMSLVDGDADLPGTSGASHDNVLP